MKAKKSKQAQLEYYSKFFFQLGLALALFITNLVLNFTTLPHRNIALDNYLHIKGEITEDLPTLL